MLASGAGAEARKAIGVVVFYGVTISVLLTLAVVPAVYTLLARSTHSPETIAKLLERLRAGQPASQSNSQPSGNGLDDGLREPDGA
jgi:hypothetical protein